MATTTKKRPPRATKRRRTSPQPSVPASGDAAVLPTRIMGRYERLAYERHARDLALSQQPGGHPQGFWYDEVEAERSVLFIESYCRHHKGEWAGKPLQLEDWQKFVQRVVYGWKRADGTRRFRTVYEEVPRKNGKSEVGAANGTYLMVADDEPGAEVYSTATKEDQAKIVWSTAAEMVAQSPTLKKWIRAYQKSLACARTRSFFKPLGADSDTLDGLNPHGHVCDELHAHKKRGVFEVMQTGMGARRQPLTFIITTAGVYDPESIGWEMHEHAQQVLDGTIEDDEFFAIIFAADDGDDWKSEATWRKANPNYGISVKPDYLKSQALAAEQRPSFLNTFLRLHLNVWTQQVTRWISVDKWNACNGILQPIETFKGRDAYIGLDLSSKLDLTACAIAIPDGDIVNFFWRFWVPAELVKERARTGKKPDYAAWVRDGWLVETPGSVIDFEFIRKEILHLRELLRIRQLGFDPWNATQLATQLEGDGFSMDDKVKKEQLVELRQGMRTLSEPSKEFEKKIVEGKIRHGNNPVMRWMVDNAAIRRDANDNIAPDKRSAAGRIDGVLASIMALSRVITEPVGRTSTYETRGVRSI